MVTMRRLGDIATIIMGQSPKGDTYNHDGIGLPLLNGPTDFGSYSPNSILFTNASKRECKKNDLIFCVRGSTTGRMNWADKKYSLGRGVCSFRGESELKTKFIRYAIEVNLEALLKQAGGGTFPNLTKDTINDFVMPFPENSEKIAAIVNVYDNLIKNNNHRIVILEKIAQSIYQEWFLKFHFPNHQIKKLIDSPLGLIPDGWEIKEISDVADVNPENITKKNAPEFIGYIDIKSVGKGLINEIKSLEFKSAPSRARRIVQDGDIIWATVRPNRKQYSYICRPEENTIVSTGFVVLRAKKIPPSYLYLFTTTDAFTSYLVNHATGSAYPAVNSGIFSKASILIPPKKLLSMFNDVVSPTMQQSFILKKKNEILKQQRDMLLPKLISGAIDISGKEYL